MRKCDDHLCISTIIVWEHRAEGEIKKNGITSVFKRFRRVKPFVCRDQVHSRHVGVML